MSIETFRPTTSGFGVPEQPLGGRVERLDLALGIDDDDAIHRRLDNRAPAQLHGPAQPVVLGDVRDVARDERCAGDLAADSAPATRSATARQSARLWCGRRTLGPEAFT